MTVYLAQRVAGVIAGAAHLALIKNVRVRIFPLLNGNRSNLLPRCGQSPNSPRKSANCPTT